MTPNKDYFLFIQLLLCKIDVALYELNSKVWLGWVAIKCQDLKFKVDFFFPVLGCDYINSLRHTIIEDKG